MQYNKTIFSLIFLFAGSICFVNAQQKDSMLIRSVNGLLQQQLYHSYQIQSAAMSINPVQHYAVAGIAYQHTKGDYRRVQQPGSLSKAGFFSEGLKKVNNFWVKGNFIYARQWDKDVMKSLRRDPDDRSPYYLWTPRTGDMNHEMYHLDGQFVAAIGKKWLIGAGASYDASDDYRTIDPRPFVNYFNFNSRLSIGYRIKSNQLISIEPLLGYGKENTSAYNKNNDSVNAPNYQIYRAEGLAEVSSASESRRQLSQWRNYSGMSIGYYLQNKKWGNWMAVYRYQDTRERSFNRFYNPTTELVYATMGYYTHFAKIQWHTSLQKWMIQAGLVLNLDKAKDFNTYLNGVNYSSFNRTQTLSFGVSSLQKNLPVHEGLFTYSHNLSEQKDGNNKADALYKYNDFQFQYRYNSYGKKNMLSMGLVAAIRNNGNSFLTLPSSANDFLFVPSVLYPDAMYFTTSHTRVGANLSYRFLAAKKLRWGIELGMEHINNTKSGLNYNEGFFRPGKNRTSWNLSVQFYL